MHHREQQGVSRSLRPSGAMRQDSARVTGVVDGIARQRPTAAPRGMLTGLCTRWPLVGWLLTGRAWLLAAGHAAAFAAVYWLAYALRFDFNLPANEWEVFRASVLWFLGAKTAVFFLMGYYHGWWRHVTFADFVALVRESAVSLVGLLALCYLVPGLAVPRSVLILDCLLTIVVLGATRSVFRMFREYFLPIVRPRKHRGAVLVGTDEASGVLAHQIRASAALPYALRGLLETNGHATGTVLGRVPVLGHIDEIQGIAVKYQVQDVLVTAGSLPGKRLRRLMEECHRAQLNLKIIPGVEDRFSGDHRNPIRDIEISDLLRREPVQLDSRGIGEMLEGRTVMVTGAGGSIGAEICRQVLRFRPYRLVLVGRGENRIFFIEHELRTRLANRLPHEGRGATGGKGTALCSRIGNITDAERMHQVFEEFHPDVVFHAAAHKHVPLMEENPGEAVRNNVLGTKVVADLAAGFHAESFVFISTDKAVRPTSVMGATKQMAERYVMALSQDSLTRFVATRFGNVLGSAGSVVPVFQEQIRAGGPITVTDPRMTRYFMSIPEASQLVLQAAAMGKGGEIFVLDMGEPVNIVDLARDLVRLSGLPEDAVEIAYTGIRPGEKLCEELYFEEENTLPTAHPRLRAVAHRPFTLADVRAEVEQLATLIYGPPQRICRRLRDFLPEYRDPRRESGPAESRPTECREPARQTY